MVLRISVYKKNPKKSIRAKKILIMSISLQTYTEPKVMFSECERERKEKGLFGKCERGKKEKVRET